MKDEEKRLKREGAEEVMRKIKESILSAMAENSGGYEYVFVSTRKIGDRFEAVAVRTSYGEVLKEASPTFDGELMSIPTVCSLRKGRKADACLIAAAPKLYKHLSEATVEYCHDCEALIKGKCVSKRGSCFVQEWRAALAEASGESEVGHD